MTLPRPSRLLALATFAALASMSSLCLALPEFPGEIENDLMLRYAPPCKICHIDGVTGGETVVTPFGYSMVSHGLGGGKSGVGSALDAMNASGVDSDGDGVTDIAELKAGTDPNSAADGDLAGPKADAGCSVVSSGNGRSGALLAALGVTGALLATRRRRSRAERRTT